MRKALLFAWLPLVVFLFPLPPQTAKQLVNEIKRDHEAAVAVHKSQATGTPAETIGREPFSKSEFDELVAALWVVWLQNLGLAALGLFVGVMAWRGRPYWQFFPLGMSIVYLAIFALSPVYSERTVPDSLLFFSTESNLIKTLQLKFSLVEIGISKGLFIRPARTIYTDFLMPVFQIAVLAWLSWSYFRRNPTAQ